uniref:Uncharacterized protein n=1 Tax=Siphoviridae sp. ctTrb4 TaxID=2826349 RepID=A0A8S5MAH4_9CAUD|nr:MAG TPA: hypothetical protein [Siphoviridae sp. ctTrb4]
MRASPVILGLTLLLGLARCFVGSSHRVIFHIQRREWVTVLAGVLLLRSRYILRPLPSGRAPLL